MEMYMTLETLQVNYKKLLHKMGVSGQYYTQKQQLYHRLMKLM
jgi:hypothetical protein